jgi:hypothetical protein
MDTRFKKGWKSERLKIFNNYGWDLLFLEGTGLTDTKIHNFLKGGC